MGCIGDCTHTVQWLVCRIGGGAYQLAGSPCAAGRPVQSCPWAGPPDCTLLLDSLKDQEENLIVVKTWTRGGGGGDKPHNQLIVPAPAQTYCNTLCPPWLMHDMQTHAVWVDTHTLALDKRRSNALFSNWQKEACSLTRSACSVKTITSHSPSNRDVISWTETRYGTALAQTSLFTPLQLSLSIPANSNYLKSPDYSEGETTDHDHYLQIRFI